uniref:Uncharacterized protein n=1 Tax=Cajanus cajan TaxID=3821 RepID=A0A151R5R6_CAJCA|nr:hypothetical protein KK1_040917 [Cajanus cajan]
MNEIVGLDVNEIWCEDPQVVKIVAKDFFKSKFQETIMDRPILDGIQFQQIDYTPTQVLDKPF